MVKQETTYTLEPIILGISGNLGSGKSLLAQYIQKRIKPFMGHFQIIELDDIRRYALWTSLEKHHIELREKLAHTFELPMDNEKSFFNREQFTEIIFSSPQMLSTYSSIVTPVLFQDAQEKIQLHPYSILVWARLLEEGYGTLVNTTTLLVYKNENKILLNGMRDRQILEPNFKEQLSLGLKHPIIPYCNFFTSQTKNDIIQEYKSIIKEHLKNNPLVYQANNSEDKQYFMDLLEAILRNYQQKNIQYAKRHNL